MNGVLPDLTWGTWDEHQWTLTQQNASAEPQTTQFTNTEPSQRERSRRKLERRGLRAPKQSQLWFEEVLTRVEGSSFSQERCTYRCNPIRCVHAETAASCAPPEGSVIPWEELPAGIHPRDGKLPPQRIRTKRLQVDNLAVFLRQILRPGDVVVEFCAGSGYVALPLACLFPECTFVLLDMKKPSLDIAEERIAAAGLKNVEIFCGLIDEYDKPFDVGIALHACGEATDMVMDQCLRAQAAFVLAPCCVGKIKLSALDYPRSNALTQLLSRTEYEVMAKAADFGHVNHAMCHSSVNVARRRCKTILESDRNQRAAEQQYQTFMCVMHPHDVTPKNDILVGIPPPTTAVGAGRTVSLPCTRVLTEHEVAKVIFGK